MLVIIIKTIIITIMIVLYIILKKLVSIWF